MESSGGNLKSPKQPVRELLVKIESYVTQSTGLSVEISEAGDVQIYQKADDRKIRFSTQDVGDVLNREDREGKAFVQINFTSGKKILLTDALVGFKPEPRANLDLNRLPKVVTTPDLLSVFEAIEEVINAEITNDEEVEVLKEVYQSILSGGESVGFDLKSERVWISRLLIGGRASA